MKGSFSVTHLKSLIAFHFGLFGLLGSCVGLGVAPLPGEHRGRARGVCPCAVGRPRHIRQVCREQKWWNPVVSLCETINIGMNEDRPSSTISGRLCSSGTEAPSVAQRSGAVNWNVRYRLQWLTLESVLRFELKHGCIESRVKRMHPVPLKHATTSGLQRIASHLERVSDERDAQER